MNRVRKQVVEVTDLISLESWDFSASAESEPTTTTQKTTTEDDATSSVSLESFASLEDLDFSKENSATKSCSVHVSVSGVIFAVDPPIFHRLEPLPWKLSNGEGNKVAAAYRPTSTSNNFCAYFTLDTSPVLFEMLLNFLMFSTLPDLTQLDLGDVEELEPLAVLLSLPELHFHLEKKMRRGPYRFRTQKNGKAFNSSASGKKSEHTLDVIHATLLKKPSEKIKRNSGSSREISSNVSVNGSQEATVRQPAFRKIQAALQNRRLSQLNQKLTHAEHCAMSDHLF